MLRAIIDGAAWASASAVQPNDRLLVGAVVVHPRAAHLLCDLACAVAAPSATCEAVGVVWRNAILKHPRPRVFFKLSIPALSLFGQVRTLVVAYFWGGGLWRRAVVCYDVHFRKVDARDPRMQLNVGAQVARLG